MFRMDLSHPTPQFRRDGWLTLDGTWQLNGRDIRVPFPPEAPASGWEGELSDTLRYERRFTLPEGFPPKGRRLILHFGAVDQMAYVFVNGRPAVSHDGGYLPFEADITELIRPGENRLDVEAVDPLSHDFPWGKQRNKPDGMWYTPFSGIWQSVWLEAVPEKRIRALRITPDLTGLTLTVDADVGSVRAAVTTPGGEELSFPLRAGRQERLEWPEPALWSPEHPSLYGLDLYAGEDIVHSYFALRTVSFAPDAGGVPRLRLNGEPVFLCGLLDQGYFPEGLVLPPEPAAYAEEAERLRSLGFNCDRKHIKLEPEAFYCACDAAGVLVLQDMVNSGAYSYFFDTALPNLGLQHRPDCLPGSRTRRAFFERHCLDTLSRLYNHPCIIGWTLFNEGWGQYDTTRLYHMLKAGDPTRFVDSTSGWFRGYESDVDSRHVYFRNRRLRPGRLPMLLSECGGYIRAVEGHLARPGRKYGYGEAETAEALTARIEALGREMILPAIPGGLCGYIYTQLTDVEGEVNGLYTYDRAVCKVDPDRLRRLNQSFRDALSAAAR